MRLVKRDILQYAMETPEHFSDLFALMHSSIVVPINLQAVIRFVNLMVQRNLRRLCLLIIKFRVTAG
ncbi:hypothetical protein DH21_22045 [Serratia marcescens]|nr:hypothetical protein DH21_22045 [Serratia marcescens]